MYSFCAFAIHADMNRDTTCFNVLADPVLLCFLAFVHADLGFPFTILGIIKWIFISFSFRTSSMFYEMLDNAGRAGEGLSVTEL